MADFNSKPAINRQDITSALTKYCRIWDIENIVGHIQIEFSKRIVRSLGRTQSEFKCIRLNPQLQTDSSDLFEEVLCHELAHIAAQHLYGNSIRPHGPEWQSLVCAAGYEPKVRLEVKLNSVPAQRSKCYTHNCPVCHTKRTAKRPMNRWRCAECVANGLSGDLEIEGEE